MLIEPVAGQPADDPLVPPRQCRHLPTPGHRGVPVVPHVVVIEDHRDGHRREQPAHRGRAPRLLVEVGVLLEVVDFGPLRRPVAILAVAPALLDVRQGAGGDVLVRVDLVADEQQQIRPVRRVLLAASDPRARRGRQCRARDRPADRSRGTTRRRAGTSIPTARAGSAMRGTSRRWARPARRRAARCTAPAPRPAARGPAPARSDGRRRRRWVPRPVRRARSWIPKRCRADRSRPRSWRRRFPFHLLRTDVPSSGPRSNRAGSSAMTRSNPARFRTPNRGLSTDRQCGCMRRSRIGLPVVAASPRHWLRRAATTRAHTQQGRLRRRRRACSTGP